MQSSKILKFEKYFKVPYDPLHMERTDRSKLLKFSREKYKLARERFHGMPMVSFLLKLPQIEPPFPKFPPLPNASFALEKYIP